MPDHRDRLSMVARIIRSRWLTIPVRLVGGFATVLAASVAAQVVMDRFRLGSNDLRAPWSLMSHLAAALMVAFAGMLSYSLFVRLTERRWPAELQPRPALRQLPQGIALGFGLSAASVMLIWGFGGYQVDGVADRSMWPSLIVRGLAIAVASSVIEELLLRGLILRILAVGLGRWWALALSSLLFGALHLANPNASVIDGLILVIEAGFMLGMAYLWTGRLWLPIGLHGGWNFALAALFGGALSGQKVTAILNARPIGPEWVSGGAFGIEGSLLSTALCSAAGFTLLVVTLRQQARIAPHYDQALTRRDVSSTLDAEEQI